MGLSGVPGRNCDSDNIPIGQIQVLKGDPGPKVQHNKLTSI